MADLLALDFELGPDLERALRDCVEDATAFCILDQRLSARQRLEQLTALGATVRWGPDGRTRLSAGRAVDDEIGLVMLTSGSSGPPKAAEITWAALRASAHITQATLRHGSDPVWFPVLPANHIGGLAVLLRAILDDASLTWGDPTDFDGALSRGATHVSVVRTHLARHDLSGFEVVLLGGARPPSLTEANVITTWGMTETGSGVVYDAEALPGVELASVDGEIIVRSPTLFRSYRSMDRPRIVGPDGADDWFPTGDGGTVIDGHLAVRGRLAYVINTGGEKVWPEDLESALASLDHIRDVAVTGVDDPQWGQRVVALVVSDGERVDDDIRAVATERIGPWAKPKEIRYVTAIPRTGNGKIRRSDLPYLQ